MPLFLAGSFAKRKMTMRSFAKRKMTMGSFTTFRKTMRSFAKLRMTGGALIIKRSGAASPPLIFSPLTPEGAHCHPERSEGPSEGTAHCHPERSEGSHHPPMKRYVILSFTNGPLVILNFAKDPGLSAGAGRPGRRLRPCSRRRCTPRTS